MVFAQLTSSLAGVLFKGQGMADPKVIATLGTKAAMHGDIKGTLHLEVTMTRRYIWVMKLRYIWAVIRARVGE